ncbi:ABC transporter ATP-binding protein [Marinobacter xestospongiae]|uniref:ATP-binding cassette domain-containing protein n=1 Tax=Marinobacter xestospongiae TaxID=994319 RepID=A0ABU3W1U2_9GAMM|nr:ATP-binding cassette domain-containing protein [Marinobacter xestospongiae]MDV2080509.1 ATP-binding cassette domain-containing protein [Marinobacter xestospongiae]
MLELDRVEVALGPKAIFNDLSLTIRPGESVCLVGPSGAGKTTLLRLAAGLLAPTSGEVTNGFRETSVVFQEPRLLPWRRVTDNIALGLKARGIGRRHRRARARELAAAVGLAESLDCFPHQLSGGMCQRVALARALAVGAELLLLDEPFSALDVGLRSDAQQLMQQLVQERALAMMLVTHDLIEALRLGHRVLVLAGSPAALVYELPVTTPFTERTPAWLHEAAARLLRQPLVQASFQPLVDREAA